MTVPRAFPLVKTLAFLLLWALALAGISAISNRSESKASAPLTSEQSGLATQGDTPKIGTQTDVEAETRRAEQALRELAAELRYLEDVTITFGKTPGGEEAVAYYVDGEILISSSHAVDVETILAHEVWHLIDYRDNGQLDWGENIPPENAPDFYR